MNSVLITSESRYPINRRKIKETVLSYLKNLGIENAEVSLAIIGSRKVKELNKSWRNLDEPTTVLTFALEEPRGADGVLRIGDIVISYPEGRIIAQEDGLSMDGAIEKLVNHGLNNLLGNRKNDSQFLSQIPAAKIS